MGVTVGKSGRLSGTSHALSMYETPLTMKYPGLDPSARYRLRVVYDLSGRKKVRLVANDSLEVHPWLGREDTVGPVEFDLPTPATDSGELTLIWYGEPGLGGNGRGCQVAEVWLVKVAG
jgi:hypothetical protein